ATCASAPAYGITSPAGILLAAVVLPVLFPNAPYRQRAARERAAAAPLLPARLRRSRAHADRPGAAAARAARHERRRARDARVHHRGTAAFRRGRHLGPPCG